MLDMVRKYVEPSAKGWRIEALDAQAFDTWMAKLIHEGIPPRTINLACRSCNVPFNDLVRLRRLPWNPLSAARPYHKAHATRRILIAEELAAIFALENDSNDDSSRRGLRGGIDGSLAPRAAGRIHLTAREALARCVVQAGGVQKAIGVCARVSRLA